MLFWFPSREEMECLVNASTRGRFGLLVNISSVCSGHVRKFMASLQNTLGISTEARYTDTARDALAPHTGLSYPIPDGVQRFLNVGIHIRCHPPLEPTWNLVP